MCSLRGANLRHLGCECPSELVSFSVITARRKVWLACLGSELRRIFIVAQKNRSMVDLGLVG
jgi:hypothetical protein